MARMSLPQMELAFICTSTCPVPGTGIGCSRNCTVLLPGRTSPVMVRALSNVAVMVSSVCRVINACCQRGAWAFYTHCRCIATTEQIRPSLVCAANALNQPWRWGSDKRETKAA